MKKRTRYTIATVVILYITICALWGWLSTELTNGCSPEYPAYSSSESQSRGVFISFVNLEPSKFDWKGKSIAIREAWVEHRSRLFYRIVLIPGYVEFPLHHQLNGYKLCFTLSEGYDCFFRPGAPFFVLDHRRNGFTQIGTVVFDESIDRPDFENMEICATDNWKFTNAFTIKASVIADNKLQPAR
jgi:hypothetical protein